MVLLFFCFLDYKLFRSGNHDYDCLCNLSWYLISCSAHRLFRNCCWDSVTVKLFIKSSFSSLLRVIAGIGEQGRHRTVSPPPSACVTCRKFILNNLESVLLVHHCLWTRWCNKVPIYNIISKELSLSTHNNRKQTSILLTLPPKYCKASHKPC